LVDNILRATSRAIPAGAEARRSWWQRLRELPVLGPVLPAVLQPRLALSFAMVFVSVAATISLAGPSLRHVRYAELRPSALRHDFYEAQGKVVKYYENIRFVYELESRIRAVRREVESPDTQPQSEPRKEIKDEPGNGRTSSLPTELSSVAGYPSRANGQRPASNEVPADFDFHGESNELCPTC
jgi:hypothetical protein